MMVDFGATEKREYLFSITAGEPPKPILTNPKVYLGITIFPLIFILHLLEIITGILSPFKPKHFMLMYIVFNIDICNIFCIIDLTLIVITILMRQTLFLDQN